MNSHISANAYQSDILVIGAGLSGLMTATGLQGSKRRITLLDKGNSVGGRLATRRIGAGRADHGAQFFTVRTSEFQRYVETWIEGGLVFPWSNGWSDGSMASTANDGHPRYAVHTGMNALAKHLASGAQKQGVTIHTGMRVIRIQQQNEGWAVYADNFTDNQMLYYSHTLVITAPAPQALALLDAGAVHLIQRDREALAAIRYDPCLCGLFWVDGEVYLPEPGAYQRPGEPISWVADNRRKGISPEATLLTVHAGAEFSRQHYDQPDDALILPLMEGILPFLDKASAIRQTQIKRWRYSQPLVLHPERYLHAVDLPPLYFGGDAFGGSRLEGAALSGLAIAGALREVENRRWAGINQSNMAQS